MSEANKQPTESAIESRTLLADAIVADLFTSGNGEEHRRGCWELAKKEPAVRHG